MIRKKSLLILIFLFVFGFIFVGVQAYSNSLQSTDQIRQEIEKRTKELKELEKQASLFRSKLKTTRALSTSLKSELKKLYYQEKTLSCSIDITKKRLDIVSLEIENLSEEISNLDEKISQNKAEVADILQEMYEKDQESLLEITLSRKHLSEVFDEMQTLIALQENLNLRIKQMEEDKAEIKARKHELENMKKEQEVLQSNLKARIAILQNQKQQKNELLKKTKNKESNYLVLLKQIEKRREEIAKEIDDLEENLRKRINYASLPEGKVLSWPASGPITQSYGATRFARTHYHSRFHNGIDIGLPIGTPIKSAAGGRVIALGNQDRYCYKGAYGKFVLIRHYNGLTTLYAHLSLIKVKVGQEVKRGQVVGYSGVTGYATGPHLHFGVYDSNTVLIKESKYCGPMPVGGSLNPMNYLP